MSQKTITITLTEREAHAVQACLSGEVENDDDYQGEYMHALRRVLKKLRSAHSSSTELRKLARQDEAAAESRR